MSDYLPGYGLPWPLETAVDQYLHSVDVRTVPVLQTQSCRFPNGRTVVIELSRPEGDEGWRFTYSVRERGTTALLPYTRLSSDEVERYLIYLMSCRNGYLVYSGL